MKNMKFSAADVLLRALPDPVESRRINLPFFHSITTTWEWSALDHAKTDEQPDLNMTVTSLVLSSNIENTFGKHNWDVVEGSLTKLGFINIEHLYFEHSAKINYPAMVFAMSDRPVNGKYPVAAIFRGTTSFYDYISDIESERNGFHKAGENAVRELARYLELHGLTKDNTTLFLTGHSYGAAIASLVAIMSEDLAERDSVFCYTFASPNYFRNGLSGDGMKMFTFVSDEDLVPGVPIGHNQDKTGHMIRLSRTDLESHAPQNYKRFLRLYLHFRDKNFDKDSETPSRFHFLNPEGLIPSKESVLRNHMPSTYMALILSEYSDEIADSFITILSKAMETVENLEWDLCAGEVCKLPFTDKKTDHGKLLWRSLDETVIHIDDRNMLTALKEGEAALTVTDEKGRAASIAVHVQDDSET